MRHGYKKVHCDCEVYGCTSPCCQCHLTEAIVKGTFAQWQSTADFSTQSRFSNRHLAWHAGFNVSYAVSSFCTGLGILIFSLKKKPCYFGIRHRMLHEASSQDTEMIEKNCSTLKGCWHLTTSGAFS